MSKKDFELVASTLAAQYERNSDRLALDRAVLALADSFEAAYPRFRKSVFLQACWSAPGVAGKS